jgi:hypothetical protein
MKCPSQGHFTFGHPAEMCRKAIVMSQIRNADFSGGMRGRHCALTGIAIEGRNSRHPAVSRRLGDGMAI